jgi:hypothetical protein
VRLTPAESDETPQLEPKVGLSARQKAFLPLLITCATFTEACEKGKLNRTTLHEWLRNPTFNAEVDRQREAIAQEAFGVLSNSLTKAAQALVSLLDAGDARLKRLAARDILDQHGKLKELDDLTQRIEQIEAKLKVSR